MSGLVGWIDFSRNLVLDRPLVSMLTSTLAQRGPDTESVWVSHKAAFGYRGLAVGHEGNDQPYVIEIGEHTVTAVVVGAPIGLTGLRERLRSRSVPVSPNAAAAELVARAHLEWPGEFPSWLTGAYALAVWDSRTEELTMAKGPMGGQGLYYTDTPTGLLFASERKTLLAHPDVRPVVDLAGFREIITHALPPGPMFAGFSQVEGAEIVRFSKAGFTRRQYWKLETRPHTDDLDTTIATVRSMLERSTRDSLPDDPSQLTVMLSGGIDSSAVAALAAAELRGRGDRDLKTFTIDFVNDEFQPDVMRTSKDAPYAEMVADRIGAAHTTVPLDAVDTLDPIIRMGVLTSMDGPTRIYDMDAAQFRFAQHVAAQGNKVVFTGFGGDNAFLGSNWTNDKGLIESGTFPWVALAQRFGAANGFGTGLLNQDTLTSLDLGTFYQDAYASAVAKVEHLPSDDAWQRKIRTVAYLVLTLFKSDYATFASAGLQTRSPISSTDVLQYAYNIPATMQRHGDIEKGLLRAAVADLLPEQIVRRPRSATPVGHHPSYPQRLQEEFKAILADANAPVRPLIDLRAATELAGAATKMIENRMLRADVELVLQLNLWLSHYRISLAL